MSSNTLDSFCSPCIPSPSSLLFGLCFLSVIDLPVYFPCVIRLPSYPSRAGGETSDLALRPEEAESVRASVLHARSVFEKAYITLKSQGTHIHLFNPPCSPICWLCG